jgi:hypothetical protein
MPHVGFNAEADGEGRKKGEKRTAEGKAPAEKPHFDGD